jgi:ParB-like chromosome segregation protein Spo0J
MRGSSSAASAPVAARQPAIVGPEVVEIPIDELEVGPSMRERGIDPAHVATLAEVPASWPPILVNRSDGSIVDGQHRVLAARQLGLRRVLGTWFDGSPEDGYLEFVRRNVAHGLPLTLVERRRAARRILSSRPDRSDRGIGALCGLSPRTVARLREEAGTDAARANGTHHPKGRVGRDGRVRPIDPAAVRAQIAEELVRQPDASLRKIASAVGASPETVRSVRNEMRAVTASSSSTPHDVQAADGSLATVRALLAGSRKAAIVDACRDDRAFTDREDGQQFVDWLNETSVEPGDLWRYVDSVPLSRVYVIADEARRRAEFWTRFAMAVEGRVRRRA